jgi:hypothetical protein
MDHDRLDRSTTLKNMENEELPGKVTKVVEYSKEKRSLDFD